MLAIYRAPMVGNATIGTMGDISIILIVLSKCEYGCVPVDSSCLHVLLCCRLSIAFGPICSLGLQYLDIEF